MSSAGIRIIGNVGKDAVLSHTQSGTAMLKFTIAVSRKDRQTKEEITDWYSVTAWGKDAEFHQEIKKGNKVFVEGRFEPSIWAPENGSPRLNLDINATAIENCSPRQQTVADDIDDLPF